MTPFIRKALYLVPTLVLLAVSSAQAAIVQFNVPLSGSGEVPGPGDSDGNGFAALSIDSATNTISWNITANSIGLPVTGAHIHKAGEGASGPIVVDFSAQLSGSGLVDSDLASVVADPHGFYANIHNSEFSAGALRGQLCDPAPVPIPAAAWLFGSGLMGLIGVARRRTSTNR